jgi:hypothetical protein
MIGYVVSNMYTRITLTRVTYYNKCIDMYTNVMTCIGICIERYRALAIAVVVVVVAAAEVEVVVVVVVVV